MRRIAAALIATTALALTAAVNAQKQIIRVATESVAVYVTVTDADKRLVPDLVLEDFEILDNGKPVSDQHLRKQAGADHDGRDDRHEWQHHRRARIREGRGRAVPAAPAPRRQGAGRRVQRQDQVPSRRIHRQPRSPDLPAPQRAGFRVPHAAVRRGGREHRAPAAGVRTQGRPGLHRRRRHREQGWRGESDGQGARERRDDLRGWPAGRVLQRPAARAHAHPIAD